MKWPLFDRLWQIIQISKPWNSYAGLAPEASNIFQTKFKFWTEAWFEVCIIHIEMIFAIINLLIHSWDERLTCFECNFSQTSRFISLLKIYFSRNNLWNKEFLLPYASMQRVMKTNQIGLRNVKKFQLNGLMGYSDLRGEGRGEVIRRVKIDAWLDIKRP